MKKFALAGISLVALAAALQSATAADLPGAYRASQNYVIFTWTGFYFGAHGGGGWGRKEVDIAPFPFGGVLVGPPSTAVDISGGLAGGQIGANYQAGSWVLGVEADASWAALSGNTACTLGIVGVPSNCHAKVDALGTFAGRLGFALDRVLLYGKGGTAFANDKYEINSLTASRSNETRWGWMVGAGIEYSFSDNWSAKIEYNYLDFGTRAVRFADTNGTLFFDTNIRESLHVAKVGINYRFGWAPVGVTY
jgi:outer membrane immunogenic protein